MTPSIHTALSVESRGAHGLGVVVKVDGTFSDGAARRIHVKILIGKWHRVGIDGRKLLVESHCDAF
jgi:hypothetical protein